MQRAGTPRALKPAAFILCLLPFLWLLWAAPTGGLGANPVERMIRHLGDWTLNFLLMTLSVTPLARLGGVSWAPGLRRMLGLFAFFYATAHLASYVVLEHFFDWGGIWRDALSHRRIFVGLASYAMLVPLALTSSAGMMRRLGLARWRRLHRLLYVSASGGVLHYLWLVKQDLRAPLLYAAVLIALFALRAVPRPGASRRS